MRRWLSFAALFVASMFSSPSCASRDQFDESILSRTELDRIKTDYIDKDVIAEYHKVESDASNARTYRDEVVLSRIRYIDAHYSVVEKSIRSGRAGLTFATDIATITLNSVGALTGTEATKSILHAISAGIIGGRAAFEKDFFSDQAPTVIIPEMQALRKQQYALIQQQLNTPTSVYSLPVALSDVDRYLRAGSITEALISLANKSGARATTAEQQADAAIRQRVVNYSNDPATQPLRQRLLRWLADPTHVEQMKTWLSQPPRSLTQISPATWVVDETVSQADLQKAVDDLHVP